MTNEYLEALKSAPDNSKEDYDTITNLESIRSMLEQSGVKRKTRKRTKKRKTSKKRKTRKHSKKRY